MSLHSQMQQQMNARFTGVRLDTMLRKIQGKMLAAAQRIEARPHVEGCKALDYVSGHQLVIQNKNDPSAMVAGFAMGIPGLSETMDTMVDVGEKLYDDLTKNLRPQDEMKLSPKQEARILQENEADLNFFRMLEEKWLQLLAFKSCGVTELRIDGVKDTLIPVESMKTPSFERDLTPEQERDLAETLAFRPKQRPNFSLGAHA